MKGIPLNILKISNGVDYMKKENKANNSNT